jgi:two-component system NarL family sensor kinase
MKKIILLCFIQLFSTLLFAQKADSLLSVLPNVTDTFKVQTLNHLCLELAYSEPDKAKQFGFEALQLSEDIKYILGKAKALNRLGIVYDVTGNYDSAIYCYLQAGVNYSSINNQYGKACAINNIGLLYAGDGKYTKALGNYFAALKIFEKENKDADVASAFNNIGSVYADLTKYHLAFNYYFKSVAINQKNNDQEELAANYTNIASSFREYGNLDSSMFYIKKSIVIEQASNNQFGLGKLYNNLGNAYVDKLEYEKALYYLFEALKIRTALNEQFGQSSTLYNIAAAYSSLNQNAKAKEYALKAHKIALELNHYKMLRKTSMMLFFLYNKTKEYEKAVQYVDLAMEARDSVLNEESSRNISELEVKYKSEKQALEIEKQTLALNNAHLEIEQKRSTIIILLIAATLVLIIGIGIYNRYRHKQQREFDAQLLSEQGLRNKAIIEAEERERIRIARELHDGIGQQLSAAKMNLSAFESKVSEQDKDTYQTMIQLVDDAVKEVRTVSHNMMPNALIRSGLVSAVRDFINKLSVTDKLKIDLEIIGLNNRLESTTETILYRVLQECVSNIIKHAQASMVSIQLVKHTDHLNILIEDNGNGFDTKKINQFEGIGLKNILSRVQFLNGTIEFDSTLGRGTTVIIDIPVKE